MLAGDWTDTGYPAVLEGAVRSGLAAAAHVRPKRAERVAECSRQSAEHRSPRSEEHTSELQSLMRISYAVFCLKKKNNNIDIQNERQSTNQEMIDTHNNDMYNTIYD